MKLKNRDLAVLEYVIPLNLISKQKLNVDIYYHSLCNATMPSTLWWEGVRNTPCLSCLNHNQPLIRERARSEVNKKVTKTLLFNPEGTCGPIWPEVVPLVLSSDFIKL